MNNFEYTRSYFRTLIESFLYSSVYGIFFDAVITTITPEPCKGACDRSEP